MQKWRRWLDNDNIYWQFFNTSSLLLDKDLLNIKLLELHNVNMSCYVNNSILFIEELRSVLALLKNNKGLVYRGNVVENPIIVRCDDWLDSDHELNLVSIYKESNMLIGEIFRYVDENEKDYTLRKLGKLFVTYNNIIKILGELIYG